MEPPRFSKAENLLRTSANHINPSCGKAHPNSITIQINLCNVLKRSGKDIEAAKNLHVAFQGRKEEFGADHPANLQTEYCLARVILAQGRAVEATEMLQASMLREVQVLGGQHEQTLSTPRLHGLALFNQRKCSEDEQLFRQVLSTRENILGMEHENTLIARNNLEAALGEPKKMERVGMYLSRITYIRQRVAPDDYHTLRVKSNLWFALEQQGKVVESDAIFNDLLADIKALPASFMDVESFKDNVTCEEEWYFWRLWNGSFDFPTLRARKRMADWIRMKPSAAVQVGGTGTTGGGMARMFSSFVKTDSQGSADELAAEIYCEVIRNMERTCGRDCEEVRVVNEDYAMLLEKQGKVHEAARVVKRLSGSGI